MGLHIGYKCKCQQNLIDGAALGDGPVKCYGLQHKVIVACRSIKIRLQPFARGI